MRLTHSAPPGPGRPHSAGHISEPGSAPTSTTHVRGTRRVTLFLQLEHTRTFQNNGERKNGPCFSVLQGRLEFGDPARAVSADDRGSGFVRAAMHPARLRQGHPCTSHRHGVEGMTTLMNRKRARCRLSHAQNRFSREPCHHPRVRAEKCDRRQVTWALSRGRGYLVLSTENARLFNRLHLFTPNLLPSQALHSGVKLPMKGSMGSPLCIWGRRHASYH